MKTRLIGAVVKGFIFFAVTSTSYAQGSGKDVYWHIDPSVKSCSMVIDPALTQAQWRTFVQQVGAIASFKSLASAEPLGTMHFSIGIEYSRTPVDQHNPAWINTFTHPDEDCPLGDAVAVPTLRARMGVSDNMDIGAYWITAPNANYGLAGGELKYRFLRESEKLPGAAVRASFTLLTGVADFDLNTYAIDVIASKRFGMFSPYLGLRGSLAVGTETTSKVNLARENILLAQGYAGITASIWVLSLAAEYDVSQVNTFAVNVGFTF